jgi:hypothetical protein
MRAGALVRPGIRIGIAVGAVLAWGAAAGLVRLPSEDQVQDPSLRERAYGPTYPAQPPAGEAVRIDRASLSADRRTLTVSFVGGWAYTAPSDFCATDYEPWLAVRGGAIEVVIVPFRHPEQATAPPDTGCFLMGYEWTFHLALAEPFTGTIVKDVGRGGTFAVGPTPVPPSLDLTHTPPPGGPASEPS